MKVHLGCGQHRLVGWTNVDLYAPADIQADIRQVDFPHRSVTLVKCTHTIEHIERDEAITLFRRIALWLLPGGRLEIETPDRLKCIKLIESGNVLVGVKGLTGGRSSDKPGWHQWIVDHVQEIIVDTNYAGYSPATRLEIPTEWDIPGERHLYVWTAKELAAALLDAGFSNARVESPLEHAKRVLRDSRVVGIR